MTTPKRITHWYAVDNAGNRIKRLTSKKSLDEYQRKYPGHKIKTHVVGWQARTWNNRTKKNKAQNFNTKAEALAWLDERRNALRKGVKIDTKKVESTTFRQLMTLYKDQQEHKMKTGKIAPSTYQSKCYRINILNDFCGDYYLAELTDDLFYDYAKMRCELVQKGSVRKELDIVSNALNLAPVAFKLKGLDNVVTRAKPTIKSDGYSGSDNERSRRLLPHEEEQISNTNTRSIYAKSAFGFSAETAIRRSELCNSSRYQIIYELKDGAGKTLQKTESWVAINDLVNTNPDYRLITKINRHKKYYQPEKRILHISADQSKTGEARDIYLSDKAIAFIDAIPASVCGRLFPVSPNSLTQWLQRVIERPANRNIEDLHWHDLRHEGTTRYFEKGFAIEEVRLSTGHASLESLLRYIELKTKDVVERLKGIG